MDGWGKVQFSLKKNYLATLGLSIVVHGIFTVACHANS